MHSIDLHGRNHTRSAHHRISQQFNKQQENTHTRKHEVGERDRDSWTEWGRQRASEGERVGKRVWEVARGPSYRSKLHTKNCRTENRRRKIITTQSTIRHTHQHAPHFCCNLFRFDYFFFPSRDREPLPYLFLCVHYFIRRESRPKERFAGDN